MGNREENMFELIGVNSPADAACQAIASVVAVPPVDAINPAIIGSSVEVAISQLDGRIIIAGSFSSVQGVPRTGLARLNSDGSVDAGFDPSANSHISCIAIQADGKILLGGQFTAFKPSGAASPISRPFLARIDINGNLDTEFDPRPNLFVDCIAIQADGKILIGGQFTSLQPNGSTSATRRGRIARLHSDGSLDVSFNPNANSEVSSLAIQDDGQILLAGSFLRLQPNGAPTPSLRSYIARVNADGSLDASFDPKANSDVYCVAIQANGKILLGGIFSSLQPNNDANATPRLNIARLNANGTLDRSFDPKVSTVVSVGGEVQSLQVQANGKILLAGNFNTLQPNGAATATPRPYVARVNADGSLDLTFDPQPNDFVRSLALQRDGKILLSGDFDLLSPNGVGAAISRRFFARLNNEDAFQTLRAYTTQILWSHQGGGPSVSMVTFELSVDGGARWKLLGLGVRVGTTPNWRIDGLNLPVNGLIRARGCVSSGPFNGSSSLIETMAAFNFHSPSKAEVE